MIHKIGTCEHCGQEIGYYIESFYAILCRSCLNEYQQARMDALAEREYYAERDGDVVCA